VKAAIISLENEASMLLSAKTTPDELCGLCSGFCHDMKRSGGSTEFLSNIV
jgi:hypothetical protein